MKENKVTVRLQERITASARTSLAWRAATDFSYCEREGCFLPKGHAGKHYPL